MKTTQITKLGMFLSIALVLSYLESLLPVVIAVPGVKMGLANIITMLLLYCTSFRQTFYFMTVRVILSGILFSGISGIAYSFIGGLFCICAMTIIKKFPFFSMIGVSMTGAIFHNVGQIIVALCVIENLHILYYLPVLCVSGTISGLIVGYLTYFILKRYNKLFLKD